MAVSRTRTTDGGISYAEHEGSPTYQISQGKLTPTRIFNIAWDDIDDFIVELFPSAQQVGDDYTIGTPLTFPSRDWLVPQSASVAPFDPQNPSWDATVGMNSYPDGGALVTVQFGQDTTNTSNDGSDNDQKLITHDVSIGGEMLMLPQNQLKWWVDGGDDIQVQEEDVRPGKIIPTLEHTITMHNVVAIPWTAIAAKIGSVNINVFTLGDFSADEGTLLYLGVNGNHDINLSGSQAWTISHRFSQRKVAGEAEGAAAIGWNHYFRPSTGKWQRIVVNDAADNIFPQVTFAELFQPEPAA